MKKSTKTGLALVLIGAFLVAGAPSAFAVGESETGWTYAVDPNCTPTEGSPAVEYVAAVYGEAPLITPAVEYQAAVYGEPPLITPAVEYQAAVTKTEYLYKQLVTGKEKWLDSLTWNPGLGWYYAQQTRVVVVTPEVPAADAVYGPAPLISAEVLAQDAVYGPAPLVSAEVPAQAAVEANDCQIATARWILPNGGTASNVTWPQAIANQANLDAILCGETVTIQVDDYPYGTAAEKARTDALGPVLEQGEDYGWAFNWRFETFTSEDCAPNPGPLVEYDEGVALDCEADVVEHRYFSRTTGEPTFDRASNTWTHGEFGEWTQYDFNAVPATDEQCPPPVIPEEPEEGDQDTGKPAGPAAEILAATGSDDATNPVNPTAGLITGMVLCALGAAALVSRFARRLRQQ